MTLEHTAETTAWAERFRLGGQNDLCAVLCAMLEHKFRRLGSDLIEQAVGAALWTAWRRRAKYDSARGTFAAWFYSIANGHCLDLLRKRARRLVLTKTPEELDRLADTRAEATGCDGIENDDAGERAAACVSVPCEMVRAGLAALPRSQRAVLTADGESPIGLADTHQLAVELGVSDSAIRQARQRGQKRLKAELERRGIEKFLGASRAERIPYREPRGCKNGKRKTENGKRKTENGKRKTENGKEHNRGGPSATRGWFPRSGHWRRYAHAGALGRI